MKSISVILGVLFTLTVFADDGLDELKASFANQIQESLPLLDRAAQMKANILPLGSLITTQECESIEAKARLVSRIDPFQFKSETDTNTLNLCGGFGGGAPDYLLERSGMTQFSQPYQRVLQHPGYEFDPLAAGKTYLYYFLDENYRIIEIQSVWYNDMTDEILGSSVVSVDSSGNVYSSIFYKTEVKADGREGRNHIESFISADGMNVEPVVRNTFEDKADPSKNQVILRLSRADKKDWDEFQLPITFADFHGFYRYGDKWYGHSNAHSSITLLKRNGEDYCATGASTANDKTSLFPSDMTEYDQCMNTH